jgi:hypothetical protein
LRNSIEMASEHDGCITSQTTGFQPEILNRDGR